MTLTQFRRLLYSLARLLGDVQAVRRGRIGHRLVNRMVGRAVGRGMRGVWR